MRHGALNCKVFHPRPAQQAREILATAERYGIDTLHLTEARTVARQLKKQARTTPYRVRGRVRRRAIVRDNLVLTRQKSRRTHLRVWGTRWRRARRNRWKGLHPARRALFCRVSGVNTLVVHGPPRPHTSAFWTRRRASARYYRRLARLLNRWARNGRPFVAGGDFNLKLWQVRQKVRADFEVVGDGIDGFIVYNLRVLATHSAEMGGRYDHPLVMIDVEEN